MAGKVQELSMIGVEPVMTLEEIAHVMGVSRKTVSDIYRDALDKLYIAFHELNIKPEDFDE